MLATYLCGAARCAAFSVLVAILAANAAADVGELAGAGGALVKQYLGAYNSHDPAQVRAFEEQHRSASALKARSMDDRLKQYGELWERWPKLDLKKVVSASDKAVTVLLAPPNGELFQFAFQLEAGDPPKLVAIAIEGPMGSADSVTATLDAAKRSAIVEDLAKTLRERYVFPEIGERMAAAIQASAAGGKYDRATSAAELSNSLTDELQAISKDKHLRVRPQSGPRRAPAPSEDQLIPAHNNYGFRKVEMLPGNIGYIRFDIFNPSEEAKRVAAAALAFVAGCDALIFDLRENGGGSPEMIKFITSYLLDQRTLLNRFRDRSGAVVDETYTDVDIPGKRFAADLPVYVLTSNHTFSGAEEFTYNLLNLQRATIVGETTGGGAHPVAPAILAETLMVTIPYMRAENPISKTNWEGVGVKPHIECPASEALERALAEIRKQGPGGAKSPE